MSDWQVPLSDLDYGSEEAEAALRVLQSKWLSMGPEVETFEREFAALLGVKHALAVANGTAAIHLAYLALDLGPGAEIIQPAINFVASANMTRAVGAQPVFADIISLEQPTIDLAEIERHITPQTRAVMVMHYGGHFCQMAEIASLCQRHGLALIEDACHAVGARYAGPDGSAVTGRAAGSIGDIGCFSFFSNKNLAVGEGGMVTTDRDDLAERLRRFRSHGMTTLTWDRHRGHAASYDVTVSGFNYRIDEVRAALGRVQLAKLALNNARRAELVARYRSALAGTPGLSLTFNTVESPEHCSYHIFPVVLAPEVDRARLMSYLRQQGVQSSMHYPPIHQFSAFSESCASLSLPVSEEFGRREVTLPLFPTMTDSQLKTVITAVATALRSAGG